MNKLKSWYKRNHCSLWALFLCLLLSGLLSISVRAEVPTQTINVPVTQWNELKSNNIKALNLIKASNLTLTEAQKSMLKAQNESLELKKLNTMQANELALAKSDLAKQSVYLSETQKSMNLLKEQIEKEQKSERRHIRQRDTWAVVAGIIAVGAIFK